MQLRREGNFGPRRLLSTVLFLWTGLLGLALAASGAAADSRAASMVIDANTGEVLHADRADEPRYPASLTKMMTLYMVFEAIEQGRLSYGSKIKVSQEAASAAPTKLDLEPGEQIAVIDAVKALITKSANDMAIALGEALGGTEGRFAEMMTERARRLGMPRTTFRNASGLPDTGQITTARDMLTLALRLQDDFPKHYPLFSTRAFSYNGSTHRNHNTLLGSLEGIDGIKTGYTRMSGFNIVTSYRRGDKHLVGAVFGGLTAGTRNTHMRFLLARALFKASSQKTRKAQPVLIARARPAIRPERKDAPAEAQVAARTEAWPQAVIKAAPKQPAAPAAAAPPPAPAQVAAARQRPAEVAAAPQTAAPAAPTMPAPAVQIAKVRPVMVAQRVRPAALPETTPASPVPPQPPAPPPAPAIAVEVQPADPAPERIATAEPAATGGVSSFAAPGLSGIAAGRATSARAPSSLEQQAASLAETPPPAAAAPTATPVIVPAGVAAPARAVIQTIPSQTQVAPTQRTPPVQTAAPAAASPARGAPPSTLQQQAQQLARGSAPVASPAPAAKPITVARADTAPSFRLRGPETQASAASGGDFQIQIGAFGSSLEAERALAQTRERAADVVGAFPPLTAPVQKADRQLYRARFAGFDARSAAATCLELRRRQIDCFVMRPE